MFDNRIHRYVFVRLLAFDAVMSIVGTVGWLAPFGIRDIGPVASLCLLIWVASAIAWAVPVARGLGPARAWARRGVACSDRELLEADAALSRAPLLIALVYSASRVAYFAGVTVLGRYAFDGLIPIGHVELAAVGFLLAGALCGPPVIIFPIAGLALHREQTALGEQISARRLDQSRETIPIAPRLVGLAISFGVGMACWYGGAMWNVVGQEARELAMRDARIEALELARALADGATELPQSTEILDADRLPPELASDDPSTPLHTTIDIRAEQITAAARIDGERFVVVRRPVELDTREFWLVNLASLVAILFGLIISLTGVVRLLTTPLDRLRRGLASFCEIGDLRQLGRLPADRKDEIGLLTLEFNRVLDVLDELSAAAQAVAGGDLRVEIEGRGDIKDAFRAMVARLAELVAQIREVAIEVASAATEIHAATQGQELAANHQSDGIREVSIALDHLATSARNISNDAGAVLANAEQTRARSDEVVDKITELGHNIAQVGELLDLIREVANRSDLLALNGSLEATRAGEAGRGFALVSAELRRLAERVTGAVTDVHATITDVGTSTEATIAATEASRVLASSTTDAARRIVEIIMSQSAETERVSASVRELAELVESSTAATSQTRATADGLRQRAAQLEQMIERFDVAPEPPPATPGPARPAS